MVLFSLKTQADSLERIRKECLKTRRVEGKHGVFKWQLVLAHQDRENPTLREVEGSALRFNLSNPNIVCFWRSEAELQDYLGKCEQNKNYINDRLKAVEERYNLSLRTAQSETQRAALSDDRQEKIHQVYEYQPHQPLMLAESALVAFRFDLAEIQELIDKTFKEYLDKFGGFPLKPQLLELTNFNFNGYSAVLKIEKLGGK